MEQVTATLRETGLDAARLELEITESAAMLNPEESMKTLAALAAQGVRIAIDDFGTGYSSLSYLKRFPIKLLKIDQAFVQDITHNADDAAIVTAIISMAHSLGLKTTAEGVETQEQFEFLRGQGCDFAQGHYFSASQPPDEITRLMEANLLGRVDPAITSP